MSTKEIVSKESMCSNTCRRDPKNYHFCPDCGRKFVFEIGQEPNEVPDAPKGPRCSTGCKQTIDYPFCVYCGNDIIDK